jgi:hypothetical protein
MKAFLLSIVDNKDVIAAAIFCLSAAFGQCMHAVKKWADGDVHSPVAWLIGNVRRTVGAFIANAGGMLLFIQTGVLGPLMAAPSGWWALFLFGFMNGFTADSALNKATREVWDADKRNGVKP